MSVPEKKKATLKNKLLVYGLIITTGLAMQAMKEAKRKEPSQRMK